jgi:hypothetical protein
MTTPALSEWESIVVGIMRSASVGRARAEEVARLNFPNLAPGTPTPRVEPKMLDVDGRPAPIGGFIRDPNIDEDEEQVEVETMFRAYGAVVYRTSQKRPSKVSRGIADLIVMFPTRGFSLWWETKRQVGGKQRPDQVQFERDCRAGGWTYRLGDRYDVARYLLNLGLAEEGDGPLGIVPARVTGISLVLADRPE